MANISAGMVKELREKTGAGMMDCKRALAESAGDFAKAEEYLRKKGIAGAESLRSVTRVPSSRSSPACPTRSTWCCRPIKRRCT